jgi:hypothetical protein
MTGRGDVAPRAMSGKEASALAFMLSFDDPRIEPLRKQADAASVNWECTCGCATIEFVIDESRASVATGLCSMILDASRRRPIEDDAFCDLLVFLKDGWLSSLELVWYSKPIAEFPAPAEFDAPEMRC